jgi:hypothetical protein
MPEVFEKYAKIPRIRGVRLTITEKLDGTNAQIVIPEDTNEPLQVGSRNRWITPGKGTDNYGFASWVQVNESMLRRLGPGRHFGEWWGVGVARTYNLIDRRWSLFNVYRFVDGLPAGLPSNVGLVPVLYQGDFSMDAIEQAKSQLATGGSVAVPGFMKPEGIVCRVQGGSGEIVWKWTFDGDIKDQPSPEQDA